MNLLKLLLVYPLSEKGTGIYYSRELSSLSPIKVGNYLSFAAVVIVTLMVKSLKNLVKMK